MVPEGRLIAARDSTGLVARGGTPDLCRRGSPNPKGEPDGTYAVLLLCETSAIGPCELNDPNAPSGIWRWRDGSWHRVDWVAKFVDGLFK